MVIGMTNMPEAKLAREAELPYATIAIATDYDCWHASEAESRSTRSRHAEAEPATTQRLIALLAASLPFLLKPSSRRPEHALLTAQSRISSRQASRACLAYPNKENTNH